MTQLTHRPVVVPGSSRGAHLVARRGRYTHHGIDCGDGTVIHYVGGWGSARRIDRTTWEAFARRSEVVVREHRRRLPVEEILRNAESRLGRYDYHLVRNNCEHFATWAVTGFGTSRQVRRWAIAAPSVAAAIGVLDAAGLQLAPVAGVGLLAYVLSRPFARLRRRVVVVGDPT